jgi:ribosomal protein S1
VEGGQKLEGKVVSISKEVVYVNVGMRSEAVLDIIEGDERFAEMKEGDSLEVFVTNPQGQVTLSLDPVMGSGDFGVLEAAQQGDEEVEGKVVSLRSGGYEVNVAGVRCFCPFSHMDLRSVAEPESMVNQTFQFKILDLERAKKNAVISRRVILEAEQRLAMASLREKLTVGAVFDGTVRDIQSFGAFVDLGGIQGLLHISQLTYGNVDKVEDVIKVGEEVKVKILDISVGNNGKERISLSMKALLPDPWDNLSLKQGDMITGTVARKSRFGIFIHLNDNIDGLRRAACSKKRAAKWTWRPSTKGNPWKSKWLT